MKRKTKLFIFLSTVAAYIAGILCFPTFEVLAADEKPLITVREISSSEAVWDVFTPNTTKEVLVNNASLLESNVWHTLYIVFIILGAVIALALAYFFFIHKIVTKKNDKKDSTLKLVSKILTIACSITVLTGTGIAGICEQLEPIYKTNYFYAGASKSVNPAPDSIKGYTEEMTNRKILSNFEYGLEGKYDRIDYAFAHYWNETSPVINYTATELDTKNAFKTDYSYVKDDGDGANVWYTLSPANADDVNENSVSKATYRLASTTSGIPNYVDSSVYDKLRVVYKGENKGKEVNLTVIVETRRGEATNDYDLLPIKYNLGTYKGESGKKVELTFNMGVIAPEDRPYISRIVFQTSTEELVANDPNSSQKNSIYFLELYSTGKVAAQGSIYKNGTTLNMSSEYLGSLGYQPYGAYSASGFYDTQAKKYRLYFGCGIPEGVCCDNVYYTETEDPQLGWAPAKRIILNDPEQKLTPYNQDPGYGGDPCVIKVKGEYYMYFSGLENGEKDGSHNMVYLAKGKDGIHFDVVGPVVQAAREGRYGAGAPCAIYKDGIFYIYYYTTARDVRYPNEPTGCILKTSTDGLNFSEGIKTTGTEGTIDVKYMPTLNCWVCTDYAEDKTGIRIGFSKDGINFAFTSGIKNYPAQEYTSSINHNPGFIGTETGFGYETMFLAYGVNDMPIFGADAALQMDTRMMNYSRVTFSLGE